MLLDRRLFSSFVVAYYVVIPTLTLILVRIQPSMEGLMALLYGIGGVLAVITAQFCDRDRISSSILLIFFTIFILYLLRPDAGLEGELTDTYFLMFTLVPLLIPQFLDVDARYLLLFAMIVPSFGVFFPVELFELNSEGNIAMDLTYSLLLPIVSTVVYLFVYWEDTSTRMKLVISPFILANLMYFVYVGLFGSRAPSLSIILCILFLFIFYHDDYDYGVYANRKRLKYVLILLLIVVISFYAIVEVLNDYLSQYGIEAGTLEKISRLQTEQDLSNGRGNLSSYTIERICESPFFGYGISSSPIVIQDSYPHNFVLQLFLDGGAFLALIILVPMINKLRLWYASCDRNDFSIITLMFFSSVIGALFSLDLWMNARLWLFFGFLLSNKMSYNKCVYE